MSNLEIYLLKKNLYQKRDFIKQNLKKYKSILNNWFLEKEQTITNFKKELEIEDCYINVTTIINAHYTYSVFVIPPNPKTFLHIEMNEIDNDSFVTIYC